MSVLSYFKRARVSRSAPLERRDIAVDYTFDIETDNLGGPFVMGGLYSSTGGYWHYDWQRENDFVDHLFSLRGVIWAHFGGGYDFKWLLDHASWRGLYVRPITSGSRIICFQIGKAVFCDSYALVPCKLSEFTAGLSVTKKELGLPCRCRKGCAGYCQITRKMPRGYRAVVSDYMRADCVSLYQALQQLRGFADEYDLDLGLTVGSSSWRELRRKYGIEENTLSTEDYYYLRRGYGGGRTELLVHGEIPIGHHWDVASMYPWAMLQPVPYGEPRRVYARYARDAFSAGRPGFYRCIVEVPESLHIPPLFVRKKAGGIAYPTGTIQGIWPLPELQHAELAGCSIFPIDAIVWPSELVLFKDYVNNTFDLRMKVARDHQNGLGKKHPMSLWLKLRLNSPYGKMGSNPDKVQYEINPPVIRGCVCKCRKCGRTYSGCECIAYDAPTKCRCRPHTQYSENVFSFPTHRIEPCARVEFAGYITGRARTHLREFLVSHRDGSDVIMYDTDSCYRRDLIEHPLIHKGKNAPLGKWEYEGVFLKFIGIAPKVYSYMTPDGVLEARAKGIALPVHFEAMPDGTERKVFEERPQIGKVYRKDSVYGFRKGAAKGQFFARDNVPRRLSEQFGSRVHVGDGMTRAPHCSEIDVL